MDLLTWIRNQWDRVGAWALVAIGGLFLILGWIGVSGTPYSFEQIPYVISGGLGGIFLLGVGAMLWISADLRDEWRKLDELVQVQRAVLDASESARVAREDSSETDRDDEVFAADGQPDAEHVADGAPIPPRPARRNGARGVARTR
jgi:hypothetical protein